MRCKKILAKIAEWQKRKTNVLSYLNNFYSQYQPKKKNKQKKKLSTLPTPRALNIRLVRYSNIFWCSLKICAIQITDFKTQK